MNEVGQVTPYVQGKELRERDEEGSRQTITDINKHAAAVMRAAGDASRDPAGESISGVADLVLDDLRRPELAGFSQLRIQDPKRLHNSAGFLQTDMPSSHGTGAVSSLTDRDALKAAEVHLAILMLLHKESLFTCCQRSWRLR